MPSVVGTLDELFFSIFSGKKGGGDCFTGRGVQLSTLFVLIIAKLSCCFYSSIVHHTLCIMKKPTDTLFRLISNMTPSEKRYFKQQEGGSENLHTQLFDYLNSLSEYREAEVRTYFEGSISVNLKVYKSQLQERLLRSLRLYHQDKSVRSQARNLLHDIEILLEKGLHEMASRKLEKVKRLCTKHEEFELLLVALGMEARLATYFLNSRREGEIIIEDMLRCLATIQEYVEQAQFNSKLLRTFDALNYAEDPEVLMAPFLEKQMEQKDKVFGSYIAARMSQHTEAVALLYKNDLGAALKASHKALELFEEVPHLKESSLLAYFNCHINFISICGQKGAFEESRESVRIIDTILRKHPHLERFSLHPLYHRLSILREQQNWPACIELADRAYRVARRHNLMEASIAQFCFLFAFEAHLAEGHYGPRGDLPFIDFFRREQNLPLPTRQVSYLLEMLQFYVSDNEDVLDSFIASLGRRLNRRKEDCAELKYYRYFFRQLLRSPLSERKAIFKEALDYHEEHAASPLHQSLKVFFHWPEWLQAQHQKRDFKRYLVETRLPQKESRTR